DRRAEAHAGPVAAQDVGGSRRWRGGRPHRRVALRAARAQSPRLTTQRLATCDGGCGGGAGGAGGRCRRVAVQARGGGQGLVLPHPRPRGCARPPRLPLLRAARNRGIAAPVRDRMSVGVAILGSTGSIGCSTLQVLARQRERFRVVALTAHSNAGLLERQAAEWEPAYVGLVNGGKRGSGPGARGSGVSCLVEAATHPDVRIVVNGVVGAAGLEATLAALAAGKRVALANKETLVMAGELVTRAALEGVEAHFLFGLPYEAVEVVVHPQSVIHAFVEFVDGSVLAQVGFPTMELPILYALTHPARVPDAGTRRFDPVAAGSLTFEAV